MQRVLCTVGTQPTTYNTIKVFSGTKPATIVKFKVAKTNLYL